MPGNGSIGGTGSCRVRLHFDKEHVVTDHGSADCDHVDPTEETTFPVVAFLGDQRISGTITRSQHLVFGWGRGVAKVEKQYQRVWKRMQTRLAGKPQRRRPRKAGLAAKRRRTRAALTRH